MVEGIKNMITKMKDEIVPLRLKTNMMHSKLEECRTLLSSTDSSIGTYLTETWKIARKYKDLKKTQANLEKDYKNLSSSVLKVFGEVCFSVNKRTMSLKINGMRRRKVPRLKKKIVIIFWNSSSS